MRKCQHLPLSLEGQKSLNVVNHELKIHINELNPLLTSSTPSALARGAVVALPGDRSPNCNGLLLK